MAKTVGRRGPLLDRLRGSESARMQGVGEQLLVLAGLLFAVLMPWLWNNGFDLQLEELVLIYVILAISLNLLFGYLGYLPFSHVAFFGLGAYAVALLSKTPLWLSVGAGLGVATVVSLILGRLTLHLKGFYFAIATLTFAAMFQLILIDAQGTTNGSDGLSVTDGLRLPLPLVSLNMTDPRTVYYLTLVVTAIIALGLWLLLRSGAGRVALAIRDHESLARSLGIYTFRFKLIAFVLASCCATLAGSLYVVYFQFISPGSVGLQTSLLLLLMILLGGRDFFWAPIIGVVLFEVGPPVVNIPEDPKWILFGAIMIAAVILLPQGIGGALIHAVHAAGRRARRAAPDTIDDEPHQQAKAVISSLPGNTARAEALRVEGLDKRFGGVHALRAVNISLPAGGEVLGLVGPNGSGKTTLFNVLSGFLRSDAGQISLFGHDITRKSPEHIARLGLVRTFQEEAAFPTLTVSEAFLVAALGVVGRNPVRLAARGLGRHRWKSTFTRSVAIKELSHGSQRMLGVGLAMGVRPSILLLDEPAAGLGPEEVEWLKDVIRLLSERGISVLLIEHHMEMIMDVCDRVVVLNMGEKIAEGTPAVVASDPEVIRAYLGSFGQVNRPASDQVAADGGS